MRKAVLAALLLGVSGSAQAVTYVGELQGTVSSRFATIFTAAGAAEDIKVGDTITARFTYVKSEAAMGGPLSWMLGQSLAQMMTNEASFELAGHRWSSRGDFLAGLVTPQFGTPEDPFAPLSLTMDDAPGAGDLAVNGYAFEIGEFGYDLYRGYGYAGLFDKNSLKLWADGVQVIGQSEPSMAPPSNAVVPEPAAWALMIAGFGLAGTAIRRKRATVSFA